MSVRKSYGLTFLRTQNVYVFPTSQKLFHIYKERLDKEQFPHFISRDFLRQMSPAFLTHIPPKRYPGCLQNCTLRLKVHFTVNLFLLQKKNKYTYAAYQSTRKLFISEL